MLEMMLGEVKLTPLVRGQAEYGVAGSYQWVCPEGVTQICVLVIGPGLPGYVRGNQATGGYGGGVRWKNNISVTPGVTYAVKVGKGDHWGTGNLPYKTPRDLEFPAVLNRSTSEFLPLWAGSREQGSPLVYSANEGGGHGEIRGPYIAGMHNGGSAGLINTKSTGTIGNGRGMNPMTAEPRYPPAGAFYGMAAGGGGNAIYLGAETDYVNNWIYAGGDGAVRIIWGNNRAYPSTNIADV